MRRLVILGLIGLLVFVILLDFQPTAHDPVITPLPTVAAVAAIHPAVPVITAPPTAASPTAASPASTNTLLPANVVIAAPTGTATPIPNPTRDAVIMTLTQMHIDATGSAPPPPTYTLRSGDTLFRIAEQYGVTVDAIMRANNVADPTRLHVGQILLIPVGIAPELVQPLVTAPPTAVAFANVIVPTATRIPFEMGNITPVFGPPPPLINGIAFDSVIVLPENVRQNIHMIFARGQALGNNPRAFSKLGDSTIEHPYFLGRFDDGPYNLGAYGYLKGAIDYFSGSFRRESVAVRRGLHTWSVLDPMWAPKPACNAGEHMLACEFRLNRPSVLFIRLGSNDAGVPEMTDENLREIIEYALANGVIPVLGTKADRHEGTSNINNTIIRQVAADYAIPLWDFDLIAQTLPGRGLDQDGVHLTTFYAHDYTRPEALQRGYGVYNLTALMMLDMIWRETISTKL
jgi:hypothetical protein